MTAFYDVVILHGKIAHNQVLFERFEKKANAKHGNKYKEGYKEVTYIDCFTSINIVCPEHGSFTQKPSDHLQGNGCQKCGRRSLQQSQRSSPQEFLQRANDVHGDTYTYPDLDACYVNAKTMISILCDTHGLFKQTPDGHLSGNGCPHCGRDTISKKLTKWTRENFIEACIKKHNRFYSYVKTLYRGLDKKITIICPNHAEFEQIANSHLRYGCFKCASEKKGIERRLGLEEFIDAAKKIHNSCYDYTKFNYTNYATPSIIICREHGEFEQTPAQHLRKHAVGCGKCGKKPYSREEIEWLDSLVCDYPEIQYATRGRQYLISTTRKHADGYDPVTNTVFEFQGCYFHGCKDCFPEQTTTNKLVKKTFQELFDLTLRREETVRSLGYNYVQIWQCEWRKQRGTLIKEAF